MSLRSGRNYLKDYAAEELDEAAGGEQQPDVATQPATTQQRSQPFDTKSQQSRTSTRRSQRTSSSTASAAARAYVKAQAARAQLAFAEKEANAMKQRAELDAHLHVLQCQKAIAAAEAEASAYEEAEIQSRELYGELCEEAEPISTVHRTNEYVQQQCELLYPDTQHDSAQPPKGNCNEVDAQDSTQITNPFITNTQTKTPPVNRERKQEQTVNTGVVDTYWSNSTKHTPNLNNCVPESSEMQQFAKYLIRKELVSTGLLQFDDKPENYWAWKTSFISATKDLNLSPREELDLLAKWLGPTSSEQAKRIRAVHTLNPAAGAKMVWQRLEECYGSPEAIEDALLKKVEDFPKLTNKDNVKLQELSDILLELQCAKQDGALPGLAYLDTARGVRQIVEKLPFNLQEKWTTVGTQYKETHSVSFPPFSVFTQFVQRQAKMRNDPSFAMSKANTHVPSPTEKLRSYSRKPTVSAHKMDITAESDQNNLSPKKMEEPDRQCPIHKKPHPLKKCKLFRDKTIEERQAYLKEHHICYRCCGSVQHIAKNCKAVVKCIECDSLKHLSAMHPGPTPAPKSTTPGNNDNEEQIESSPSVESKCTEVCGQGDSPRSCSKISLVKVYPAGQKERAIKMYAVIDDQSNRSLVKSEFFSLFKINAKPTPYTLKTCSGREQTSGRRAVNFFLESLDGEVNIQLPPLIECDSVPDNRSEIPSPEIAQHHPHLLPVTDNIPPVDHHAPILLLLGRDVIRVHKVREQINGPNDAPYAQRLDLGWVIVGEVCLGKVHSQSEVNVYKTHTLDNGRASYFEPCPNTIHVKENYGVTMNATCITDDLGHSVFVRSEGDNKQAMSIDDRAFLTIMDSEVYQNQENSWVAPLPFRSQRRRLPDNREQALKRLCSLRKTLEKRPEMKDHYIQFMQKMLDNDQAEPAPPLPLNKEHWYLPTFGVYHPQKPQQIRVVFDSSAECDGISLNQVLLGGPDLNNSLLGVLLRFRKEPIALTADVQQMFYCFVVREDHRDYLRYLWYEDNDITKSIVEFRMKVHVFGNSPSPAVAIYCMRQAAQQGEREHGSDARQFVERQFYVDDGLTSVATPEEAINLLTRTQNMLAESNLRLHKVASNCSQVMEAFPVEDRAKDLKDLDLGVDPLPVQRSLGLCWNLQSDSFTYQVSNESKPFTRRGVLSTVNSLYDPLGFAAPIIMQGKALLRELSSDGKDWDTLLPPEKQERWDLWKDSLQALENLQIPRCYSPGTLSTTKVKELCIFCDASTVAIGAVVYLRTVDSEGQCHTGFVMGKSKLAPRPAHTVPRLELCAAVLAVEMFELIRDELDIKVDNVTFYTDSRIVLGYIHNTSRRFYMYVANRVTRIRASTHPSQWHYVPSELNPADQATRFIPAADLQNSTWFSGPPFLYSDPHTEPHTGPFTLIEPEKDREIHPEIKVMKTTVAEPQLGSDRFKKYSNWITLCRVIARLIHVVTSFAQKTSGRRGWKGFSETPSVQELTRAQVVIIRAVQQEAYKGTLENIKEGRKVSGMFDTLKKLDPVVDKDSLLRVGGRLCAADLTENEKHPLIIPSTSHIAMLIVTHYHERVAHQGRHITEGAIRGAGYWIIGGKRLVSSVIHRCVTCRKLRGKMQIQKMADLPADRVTPEPPFTTVGLDVFGPWTIVTRRTRGGCSQNKRWAVLFTCMSTRAVHIELIETMSADSFINALRRLFSIRGPAKFLRSDRGTNFVGACKELDLNSGNKAVGKYLQERGCVWTFNPPHASHMGGSWERLIGVARRILDAMLLRTEQTRLTHEVLCTFMAEVMAIINARPLVPISTDPDSPAVLTPAVLLTQKMSAVSAPLGNFSSGQLFGKQWKHVQLLADTFWKRWKGEYLSTLQGRAKWTETRPNVKIGDVVLLKDPQASRNEWPMGLIVKTFPSSDKKVRKVEVRTVKDGTVKMFLRPVSEIVVLLAETE
ncbi:uncharacterized protein LOC113013640 [Astatotilapia calliptera]|uniref:uncharacterized protein LOC113013640 n=1 Tax=Astatotilapia calliptera TaxID=8154 RepID=UPI000E41BFC0|nr:uncharacterized protein LOC113013640 [Astatotilapia calliptera]